MTVHLLLKNFLFKNHQQGKEQTEQDQEFFLKLDFVVFIFVFCCIFHIIECERESNVQGHQKDRLGTGGVKSKSQTEKSAFFPKGNRKPIIGKGRG